MKNDKVWLMQGDCLDLMKEIPDGSVNMILCDLEIVGLYKSGLSMREISKRLNTNHKLISRILKKCGVITRPPKGKPKNKFECSIERKYSNMATHMRFNVSLEWLLQFEDFEKLKTLNNCITNRDNRFNESDEWYKNYILKFYFDEDFNKIYETWIKHGKMKYLKPSIDHINPRSKGGDNSLGNLQFLTWFENRCKNDLSQSEWDFIKLNIEEFFI